MANLLLLLITMATVMLSACALEKGEILEMTYVLDETTPLWPGNGQFEFTIVNRGPSDLYPWFENNKFCSPEHAGTHIDAPAHFGQGKWRVNDIPLNRLIAPAVRIDASRQAAINTDYELTVNDIQTWEEVNGKLPDGSLLFFYTGWGVRWPDRLSFYGSARNDTSIDDQGKSIVHFPGIAPAAATWIRENRNIYGLATETPSIDYGPSVNVTVHQILFDANIYALENVANMDQLPTKGAVVHALPFLIRDGSGSPVRIVAQLDEEERTGSGGGSVKSAGSWAVGSIAATAFIVTKARII